MNGHRLDLGTASTLGITIPTRRRAALAASFSRRTVLGAGAAALLGGVITVQTARAAYDEGWQYCQKCRVLHSTASGRGPCAAGGRHSIQGSFRYYLASGPDLAGPLQEDHWRFCRKCHGLHSILTGDRGPCPDGGRHSVQGSLEYVISRNFPPEPGLQGGWRHCTKCQSLHWVGDGTRGPCHGGGRHNQGRFGFDYQVLYHQ